MTSTPASSRDPRPPQTQVAQVRLEVRVGGARATVYEVGDGGFLVGSVPGCDLRLPGANLAPVLCLIARQPSGATLRKLAPVQPITVNGRSVSATYLADGDRISLGAAELVVGITVPTAAPAPPTPVAVPVVEAPARLRQIEEREQVLVRQAREVEAERLLLQRQREEFEGQAHQSTQRLEAATLELLRRESALEERLRSSEKEHVGVTSRAADLARQELELDNLRKELGRVRSELVERYQNRRDRMLTKEQAILRAGRKLQDRKRDIDGREVVIVRREQETARLQEEVLARGEQVARERQVLEEQLAQIASRQQEIQRELSERHEAHTAKEKSLAAEKAALEKSQKEHQTDLVRLDRIQAGIEQRQKQLADRALDIDKRFELLQRETRDLEEQAKQMDEWHNRLASEAEQLSGQKKEQETLASQLNERAAALEGQQAMLTTLRTRLERMREELRRQEQSLSDQRLLQEATEGDLKKRLEEVEQLKQDNLHDKQLFEEERRRFDERRTTMEQAVTQLRQTQQSLVNEQAEIQRQREQLEATAAEQTTQADALLARGAQFDQLQQRIQTDKQAIREREQSLARAEQMLSTLQEQVRRRSEEIDTRQKQLKENETKTQERLAAAEARLAQTEQLNETAASELDALQQELANQTALVEERSKQLVTQEEALAVRLSELEEQQAAFTIQKQTLTSDRIAWEVERQASAEQERRGREELLRLREELQGMSRQLPDMELRATAALERLTRAREQLREHLAEVHSYARQSREELESARKQVQSEVERVRQQELELQVARDEHRLAVVAFRQQCIEWQGRVGEMKQALQLGGARLEQEKAQIEQQALAVASRSAKLEIESQELQRAKRDIAERRDEVDRHLVDMQEWYRRKLRELAGYVGPNDAPAVKGDPESADNDRNPARAVLTLDEAVEPGDRQLGELLESCGLVDGDTLRVLWAEARRQRRSLRQLLLTAGKLTLFQMALIEAGNLDGLVLGPVRIIDKLSSTPREAVYRVFDPRRNLEAILRHLSESEMQDALRPDEFVQRFSAAAAVRHGNVATVLEVLTIADRPAVLVEYVPGLPCADWPTLVSAPGIWYRLVGQSALALNAAHQAGVCHGRIDGGAFVLTDGGIVKLVGLGEPRWLSSLEPEQDESAAGDLEGLGRLAAIWASPPASGKNSKPKPMPEELQTVLSRLTSADPATRYASAQALVEDLQRAGTKAPASNTTWDRLLKHVREQAPSGPLRQSA